jgi:membrane protein
MSAVEFAGGLFTRWKNHALGGSAAQVSYFLLFSVFPALVFVVALAAYLPLGESVETGLSHLSGMLPPQALEVLSRQAHSLLLRPRPHLLAASALISLWSATRGITAARRALNVVWEVPESRPFWKTQGMSLVIALVGAALALVSLAAMVAGGNAGAWLANRFGISHWYPWLWAWARWPVAGLAEMFSAALAYWLLPAVPTRFRFVSPGTVTSAGVWLVATWGLTQYSEHFGNYNATFGSIAGAALLLLWLYVSALTLLFGAEVDAVVGQPRVEAQRPRTVRWPASSRA